MTKKRIIMAITVISIISMGMLTACGKTAIETEESTEESSFGLKDYEGLYCATITDEIEGNNVTYTWGYQFNGDGTGMYYGQDNLELTWNETEIHCGGHAETFTMEPGKLTVNGITYDKVEGNFITPNPCEVDVDNIENGIYHIYVSDYGMKEDNGKLTLDVEINTVETFDIVDINRMAVGDVIYIDGVLLPINSIDQTTWGIININGGIENFGSALVAEDESNCFVHAGIDMEKSYKSHGIAKLPVSDNVKLINQRNLPDVKEYTGSEAISLFKEMVNEGPLFCDNCSIMVENGEIIEITRLYTP